MSWLDLNIVWGEKENHIWFLAVVIFPTLVFYGFWQRRILLKRLGKFDVLQKMLPTKGGSRELISLVLLCVSFTLLVLAYMKPQWGEQTRLVETKTLDILLLQDVSQSMLAEDVKPSRLLRSQHEISYFIDRLEGDRIGLMAFGASTRLLCPMTQDYNAIKMFLKELDPTMVLQGTDVALAIKNGLNRFSDESIQSKLMILLSDGEEHDPNAIELAKEASRRGIKIYTVGIGALEGVRIPDPRRRGQWKKDSQGKEILTKLNEDLLKEIAEITEAEYFHASGGGFQLTQILDAIRDLERDSLGESEVVEYEQKYFLFALIALILLLLEWLIPRDRFQTRRIRKVQSMSLFLLWIPLFLSACQSENMAENMAENNTKSCFQDQSRCLDRSWSHLLQLDSAQTQLDTLFWLIESQAYALEGHHQDPDRAMKLFSLANDIKWPTLSKIDSMSLSMEKLPELDSELKKLESEVIHNWYGLEYDYLKRLSQEMGTNTKALLLTDLQLRLQDLKDIESGVLPQRDMTWSHRLIEWGRQ